MARGIAEVPSVMLEMRDWAALEKHLKREGLLPPFRRKGQLRADLDSEFVEGDVNPCMVEDETWP